MAGLKIKNIVIRSFLFYLFAFFIFLFSWHQHDCLELFEILFLNYALFPQYMLEKFSITLLVLNVLMFFLFLHPQISDLLENTSFLGLGSHKRRKKQLILNILWDTVLVNGLLLIFTFAEILGIGTIGNLLVQEKLIFDFDLCLRLFIFLVKYFLWQLIFVSAMRLAALIHPISHGEIVPYLVLSAGIIFDSSFNTHWMNMADSIPSGIVDIIIILMIGMVADGYMIYKINHSKEIFV